MRLVLPYPPTINHYYGHTTTRSGRPRMYIKPAGKTFRRSVALQIMVLGLGKKPMTGPIAMTLEWHPPDRRKRDGDNLLKATQDALQYAGVYKDDSQIVDLRVVKRDVHKGGKIIVTIEESNA